MIILSLWSVSASYGILLLWVLLVVSSGWPLSSLPSPRCLCWCPCGLPPQRLFPCLLLSGLPPFRILLTAVFSLTLCWHLPFPGPACNWVTSQFIHLSYTLLCYCFLLYSQLQLLSCPLSQSQLFLGLHTCAEPSLNRPMGTSICRSPRGAVRNQTAPCAVSEAVSARFRQAKDVC